MNSLLSKSSYKNGNTNLDCVIPLRKIVIIRWLILLLAVFGCSSEATTRVKPTSRSNPIQSVGDEQEAKAAQQPQEEDPIVNDTNKIALQPKDPHHQKLDPLRRAVKPSTEYRRPAVDRMSEYKRKKHQECLQRMDQLDPATVLHEVYGTLKRYKSKVSIRMEWHGLPRGSFQGHLVFTAPNTTTIRYRNGRRVQIDSDRVTVRESWKAPSTTFVISEVDRMSKIPDGFLEYFATSFLRGDIDSCCSWIWTSCDDYTTAVGLLEAKRGYWNRIQIQLHNENHKIVRIILSNKRIGFNGWTWFMSLFEPY